MKLGAKQKIASATVFAGIIGGLIYVDPRVREHFAMLWAGGTAPWQSRASDLGGVVVEAARQQGIDNGPLVIFAIVSAVLVLFMWRT
jgi:hypothetical protein